MVRVCVGGWLGVRREGVIVGAVVKGKVPLYGIILATLGWQVRVERITILTAGDQPRTFPPFTAGGPWKLGSVAVSYQTFWIFGCSMVLALLLWLFFTRTRTGWALRACSQNPEAASLLGIPVRRMVAISFGISAGLGAIAGILITPTRSTSFCVGARFGLVGFV